MLTAAQVGLPIIEALGITGPVASVTLRCQAGEVPTLEVLSYVMADGKFVFEPCDPKKLRTALGRYRLTEARGFAPDTTKGTEMLKLGNKVRDRITGNVGILYARAVYLYGDGPRWCLQAPVREDGKVPEEQWLDEGRLELVEE